MQKFTFFFSDGDCPQQAKKRFSTDKLTTQDVDERIANTENANTKKKTKYDVQLFQQFLKEVHSITTPIEDIPPEVLESRLSQFILVVKKKTVGITNRQLSKGCFSAFTAT